MPRNITVTFDDGSSHVYENAPDNLTPDAVTARAQKDFGKAVTALDGGRGGIPTGRRGVDQIPGNDGAAPAPVVTRDQQRKDLFAKELRQLGAPFRGFSSGVANVMFGAQRLLGKGVSALENVDNAGAFLQADAARRLAQEQAKIAPVKQEFPMATGAGEFGGEIAGTLGVGPALAGGARMLGAAPSVARALQFGGMVPTGATTVSRGAAARLGAGATVGGVSGAVINPEDAGISAALGAALPAVVAPVKGAVTSLYRGVVQPLTSPSVTAENALLASLGKNSQAATNALRDTQGMLTTPGFTPTLTERLVERGAATPTVAAMESRLRGASPEINRQIYEQAQQRVGALEGQLQRVEQQLQQQASVLRPEAQVELRAVRDQLMQGLAQVRQEATVAQQALAAKLPDVSQIRIGGVLSEAAEKELAAARSRVSAEYTKAFQSAGNEPVIPFENVVARAGIIRDQPIQELKGLAPETAKVLELYGAKPAPAIPLGSGKVSGKIMQRAPEPLPPNVTLEQASALGQALNIDYAALKGSTDSASNIARANINKMRSELDTAIANSGLSNEAKAAYATAKKAHATEVAERFYTGTASKLTREGASRVPLLGDENIARSILQTETGARDLLAAIGPSPAARQSLVQGIEDLFRRDIIDPTTKTVRPDAAAAFLQKNGRQIDMVGGDLRQRLTQVQQEAAKFADDFKQIGALRDELGKKTTAEVIDYALKHPSNMGLVQSRIGKDAQSALAREVADRAIDPLKAGNADAAVDFLTKNAATARQAFGKGAYDDLLQQAKFGQEVAKQAKSLQAFGKDVEGVVFTRTQDFTPQQLTDLSLVARDLQRAARAEGLSRQGTRVAAPDVGELATEAAQTEAISARKFPQLLNRLATVTRNTWINLEGRINQRAAAELVTLMHTNPDAAIVALERAQKRAAIQARGPGAISRTTAQGVRISGATPNALAPESRKENALAP